MENNENMKAKAEVLLDALQAKQNLINTREYVKFVESTLPTYRLAIRSYDFKAKTLALDALLTVVPDLLTIIKAQSEALDETINIMAELYGDLSNNDQKKEET